MSDAHSEFVEMIEYLDSLIEKYLMIGAPGSRSVHDPALAYIHREKDAIIKAYASIKPPPIMIFVTDDHHYQF